MCVVTRQDVIPSVCVSIPDSGKRFYSFQRFQTESEAFFRGSSVCVVTRQGAIPSICGSISDSGSKDFILFNDSRPILRPSPEVAQCA